MDHSEQQDGDGLGELVMVDDLDGDELEALGLAEAAPEAEAEAVEPEPPRLELSTGLLTPAQNATVAAWIERLRLDVPLPGLEPKGPMLRTIGIDDRPPASISDVIAAAVYDMCRRRMPAAKTVARYVVEARAASRRQLTDRGQHKPVTVVLRGDLAEAVEALPGQVAAWLVKTRGDLVEAAAAKYPGEDEGPSRTQYVEVELIRLGLHAAYADGYPRKIPIGAVARMGIDHWQGKPVDKTILAAIGYAEDVKLQRHRMRKDAHRRG